MQYSTQDRFQSADSRSPELEDSAPVSVSPDRSGKSSVVPDHSARSGQMVPASLPRHMPAVTYSQYGDPDQLQLTTVPTPRPKRRQALIRVDYASVNPIDARLRSGEAKYFLPGGFPRIPGFDVAGTVVDMGDECRWAVGTRVLAFLDQFYGGGYAAYAIAGQEAIAAIPDSMPTSEAAALPLAGSTALQCLRDYGKLHPGMKVLVNGGSGGVGAFGIQIAVAGGAQVTAVSSGSNENFCRSIGASDFIDYHQRDFTADGRQYDLIFDAAGKSNFQQAKSALTDDGRYVTTEPTPRSLYWKLQARLKGQYATAMLARPKADDLRQLVTLYSEKKLSVTIAQTFDFADAARAHERLEAGVGRGKLNLRVAGDQ